MNYEITPELVEIKDARLSQVIDDLDNSLFNILDYKVIDPLLHTEVSYKSILKKIQSGGGVPNYKNIKIILSLLHELPNYFKSGRSTLIKGLKEYDELLESISDELTRLTNHISDQEKSLEDLNQLVYDLKEENVGLRASLYIVEEKIKLARLEEQNKAMSDFYSPKKNNKSEEVIVEKVVEVEDEDCELN